MGSLGVSLRPNRDFHLITNVRRVSNMKRISMQFCPSCGSYWVPIGPEEASRKIVPRCKTCHVRVGLSWLGFIILGILLYILMATALFQLANRVALGILVFFLGIAALKAVQQHQASKRTPSGEQKDSGDK